MKVCVQCNTEYENDADYCNICEIPLDAETSISKPKTMERDTQIIIARSRRTLILVHRIAAALYAPAIALLAYILIVSTSEITKHLSFFLFLFIAISSLPLLHLILAYGIKRQKRWAHSISMTLSFILLIVFPIGTIIAAILLNNHFKKEWNEVFA